MSGSHNNTQTNTLDPHLMSLYQQNYERAAGMANTPLP